MKLSCRVAEDLLPLYHDEVCSAESRALVEEHLAECEACRDLLRKMDGEVKVNQKKDDMKPLAGIRSEWLRIRKSRSIRIRDALNVCDAISISSSTLRTLSAVSMR